MIMVIQSKLTENVCNEQQIFGLELPGNQSKKGSMMSYYFLLSYLKFKKEIIFDF